FTPILPLPPSTTLFPYTTLFRSFQRWTSAGRTVGDLPHHITAIGHHHVIFNHGYTNFRLSNRRVAVVTVSAHCNYLGGELSKSLDRKSTRLNSSHVKISYAVFCL